MDGLPALGGTSNEEAKDRANNGAVRDEGQETGGRPEARSRVRSRSRSHPAKSHGKNNGYTEYTT